MTDATELLKILTYRAGGGNDIWRVDNESLRFSINKENTTIIVDFFKTADDARDEQNRIRREEFAVYRLSNGRPVE